MTEKAIAKRIETEWFDELITDIRNLEYTGIVLTKHAIGKRIIQDELKFGKPEYGSHKIEEIAKELDISWGELYKCIQFSKKYPELCDDITKLSWYRITHSLLPSSSRKNEEIETTELPDNVFEVIYADPPWKYSDELIEKYGAATHHYPCMSIQQLCEYKIKQEGNKEKKAIKDIAAINSVLFLWVTSPFLDECWPIIKAWGFEYKSSFVWDKQKHNYGHYNSVRHELLLLCTRGSFLPQNNKLFDSVQSVERSEKHSEKPEYFRTEIIEKMYPDSRKVELFGRKFVPGWTVIRNKAEIR